MQRVGKRGRLGIQGGVAKEQVTVRVSPEPMNMGGVLGRRRSCQNSRLWVWWSWRPGCELCGGRLGGVQADGGELGATGRLLVTAVLPLRTSGQRCVWICESPGKGGEEGWQWPCLGPFGPQGWTRELCPNLGSLPAGWTRL